MPQTGGGEISCREQGKEILQVEIVTNDNNKYFFPTKF